MMRVERDIKAISMNQDQIMHDAMFSRARYKDAIYENVTSYQILQRNLNSNTARVKLANGNIISLGIGGPYTINNAHSVYVGDIWIMAGQSNMRGHGYFNDGEKNVLLEPKPGIHLYQSNETWGIAQDPTHRLSESPRSVHHRIPDPTVRNPSILHVRGASLGLSFAQSYQKRNNNIPVGLVASAHGGTSSAQWMERDPDNPSSTLYGAMMARIGQVGGNIAGVLWYQGETDACSSDPKPYGRNTIDLLADMVRDMDSGIPIVCVQLGRCVGGNHIQDSHWNLIREVQYRCLAPRHIGAETRLCAVSSIDASMDDFIHLSAQGLTKVGYRLGVAATFAMQNKAYMATPRMVFAGYEEKNEFTMRRCTIKVSFENLDNDVTWTPMDEVLGFSIRHQNEDKHELPIILSARIENQRSIRIYLTGDALQLRGSYVLYYGWGKNPCCNLTTTSGMGLLASRISFAIEHPH
ncbi:SGNH hydrolase-type esterase domain-containing protein [Phascolomyces articulosus]|uniref:SGNH hydrolase-type esterase domain-containing protein n=1 Tax=Phascolomyces articulosus TaxID=60185 RepID=A0AAD5JLT8_9FUNG|nr:SGNH hydrolase-type esterase domain-containing protein [Phascolomyces articulosus]